jgi:hypothetical protein
MCASFEAEYPFPLPLSLSLFSVIVIWGLWKVKLSQYSLLTRAMIVLYAVPFMHCFPYLWDENIFYLDLIWGMAANPYQKDLEIIKRMVMVGCIGAFGLVAGYLSARMTKYRRADKLVTVDKSLDMPAFFLIAIISLFLSWINAPKETILNAAYTTSESLLHGINFNGAAILSYIYFLLLIIDVFNEKQIQIQRLKLKISLFVALIIVIWLQFMRGDRTCIGMIVGFAMIYFLNTSSKFNFNIKKYVIVAGLFVIVFFTAQIVGDVRGEWHNMQEKTIPIKDIKISSGTWSAALLTPLSVVGDFYYGEMELRWGQTYWDYLLSLPPGVFTQFMGIERPVEATHGPAWEMHFGRGGTHAMVVPFMNFKSYGVFFVLLLYGFILGKLEMKIRIPHGVKIKLLYASFFVFSPSWFWYGEMFFIRGIMAFYIVWFSYRLLPKLGEIRITKDIIQ